MTATAVSLSPHENSETVDFLRRLASMMSGGKNAEMLLGAAGIIEALTDRAVTAERLCSEPRDERERNNQLREAVEIATENLSSEAAALRAQLADAVRQAEIDRASLTEQAHRLSARAEDAESRLAKVNAELDELRTPFAELSDTVVAVPTEQLRLARAQFDFLADGFAKNGDVISQTICEIGRCAIEQALPGNKPGPHATR